MTIKQFAKERDISSQAIYQRLKREGLKISQLKQENSQELTEAGIKTLEGLFADAKEAREESRPIENQDSIEKLKTEIDYLKKRVEELEAERDRWAKQAESAQMTAQQAQAISMANLKALPAPRRSLWDIITRKK